MRFRSQNIWVLTFYTVVSCQDTNFTISTNQTSSSNVTTRDLNNPKKGHSKNENRLIDIEENIHHKQPEPTETWQEQHEMD